MSRKHEPLPTLSTIVSGSSLANGLIFIGNHFSKIDSIRDAVYIHADKITPEIIERANNLVSEVGKGDYYMALISFGTMSLSGYMTYLLSKDDTPRPKGRGI